MTLTLAKEFIEIDQLLTDALGAESKTAKEIRSRLGALHSSVGERIAQQASPSTADALDDEGKSWLIERILLQMVTLKEASSTNAEEDEMECIMRDIEEDLYALAFGQKE